MNLLDDEDDDDDDDDDGDGDGKIIFANHSFGLENDGSVQSGAAKVHLRFRFSTERFFFSFEVVVLYRDVEMPPGKLY